MYIIRNTGIVLRVAPGEWEWVSHVGSSKANDTFIENICSSITVYPIHLLCNVIISVTYLYHVTKKCRFASLLVMALISDINLTLDFIDTFSGKFKSIISKKIRLKLLSW